MDDFNLKSLAASKNEWSSRLINILYPCVVEGYKSILKESITRTLTIPCRRAGVMQTADNAVCAVQNT